MPVIQPPINQDPIKGAWEYEVTYTVNNLEGRALALLNSLSGDNDAAKLVALVNAYESIKERLGTAQLYIQDNEPNPVYADSFMWLQTNVNDEGDFSLWFCNEK